MGKGHGGQGHLTTEQEGLRAAGNSCNQVKATPANFFSVYVTLFSCTLDAHNTRCRLQDYLVHLYRLVLQGMGDDLHERIPAMALTRGQSRGWKTVVAGKTGLADKVIPILRKIQTPSSSQTQKKINRSVNSLN